MSTQNLLVELFVEELPPKALKKLGEAFASVLAEQLSRIDLGAILFVEGFLAPRSRNARSLILHLTRFRLET
jgi:glycyl-tRNA synthetase beta chain